MSRFGDGANVGAGERLFDGVPDPDPLRPPPSLVQTAKVTRWRQPAQPRGRCGKGSHHG